ncbi:hypothetical protein AAG906_000322 [Vitis piasezkii]
MSIQMDGTSFLQDTIMCPSSPEFVHQPDKSGTFILTPDSFHISRKTISIPTQPTQLTSELTAKRGGTLDIQNPNLDVSLALLSSEEEFEFFEYSSEAKDSISESTEYVVLPRTIKPVKTTISLINTFFALGSIKNQEDLDQILHELDVLKIIGEDPLAHWSKNEIECHLVIKNPDYIISGAQIEFSNLDQEKCKTQIDELLKLKIISPSMSKHRSAFMSKPWTAFTCSEGLFEWNAMSFGLKNAPAVFQRKMDNIFKDVKSFVAVYIDDVLVFSPDYNTHLGHLQVVFKKFIDHGLIVLINFLGNIIGNGEIELQDHIASKILGMPDKLGTLKELQQFLGLLYYAREYIKDLSRLAGPLIAKIRKTGQRFFNQQDIKLVQKIKEIVKSLPSLQLPLDSDYLIVENDASQDGWGAILLCKPNKYSDKKTERVCRYASGKFKVKVESAIEAELCGVIEALNNFRLFLIGKRWVHFETAIVGNGLKPNFKHIKGKDNNKADILSRIIQDSK